MSRRILIFLLAAVGIIFLLHITDTFSTADIVSQITGGHGTTDSGGHEGGGHHDRFAVVYEALVLVLISALIGRFLAKKTKQAPVLGELVVGIIIGSLFYMVGNPAVYIIRHYDIVQHAIGEMASHDLTWQTVVSDVLLDAKLKEKELGTLTSILLNYKFPDFLTLTNSAMLFSSLGVILLLFMVGLEIEISELKKVGVSALIVAIIGVVAPFFMGFYISKFLLPLQSLNTHIFVGATLCATSIGITARVFKDMGKLGMGEAKIVLGAAVIDDVLGLIILAVVTGLVTTGVFELKNIIIITLKSILFFAAVIIFKMKGLMKVIGGFGKLETNNLKLLFSFILLMLFTFLADFIGLATIVGAFAAGLILSDEAFGKNTSGKKTLEGLFHPFESIFSPVFFVLIGFQVDVTTLFDIDILLIGLAITGVAIIGKLVSTVALKKGYNKWVVGIGMVPRGEVGLIFASMGKAMGVLNSTLFSIIIIVVILSTLITPPFLAMAIKNTEKKKQALA
jgi:Kef-type K+ transport system membrane component KefB